MKTIISLCDYSGVWSQPYADAGYRVVLVDIARNGIDVTQWLPDEKPYAVLAAPPCTCFCRPAARHWFKQDFTGQTAKNVAVFEACLQICKTSTGWWALENPPGRHGDFMPDLGKPTWQFQPYEYGDPWGKQTYIWGTAKKPEPRNQVKPEPTRRTPNGKTQGRIAWMSSSHKRKREETPAGFAQAFFDANP